MGDEALALFWELDVSSSLYSEIFIVSKVVTEEILFSIGGAVWNKHQS